MVFSASCILLERGGGGLVKRWLDCSALERRITITAQ